MLKATVLKNKLPKIQKLNVAALSFFILLLGVGRMFSLTLHDPLLAYANSYEMIPLQACHQIWPADANIDITRGTPAAPLRHYTLSKHVETPCLSSSELLFTGLGIELAGIQNHFTGGDVISLQTIGFVKALFLAITALMAQLYFLKHQHHPALLIHALAMLVVLSDPGITLYLNTFYTEFSSVYFLYLTLIGVAVFFIAPTQPKHFAVDALRSLPLLLGLIGFGLSKAQHLPVLLCLGLCLAFYIFTYKSRWMALAVALCVLTTYTLVETNTFTSSNDNIAKANKINVMGSALGIAKNPKALLDDLNLPESCLALAGKNWYAPVVQKDKICFEVFDLGSAKIAYTLAIHPDVLSGLVWTGSSRLPVWIFSLYGQVESERQASVDAYYWSIANLAKSIPQGFFFTLLIAPFCVVCAYCFWCLFRHSKTSLQHSLQKWNGLLLLTLLPTAIYVETLLESGFVDLGKHVHLVVPLTLFVYVVLLVYPGSKIVSDIIKKNLATH